MKHLPSRRFLCGLSAILLVITGGGILLRSKGDTTNPDKFAGRSSETRSRPRVERAPPPPGSRERHQMSQAVRALKEKLLAEFPELRIEGIPVPDEENGFLQIHLIADEVASISEELLNLISGRSEWDSARVEELIEEHADLFGRIKAIASLENRSSTDLPSSYKGFVSARTAMVAGNLLLAKARLASEAGDEEAALRFAALTRNLASHFSEVETRTFLMETVAIIVNQNLQKIVFENLLPNLGPSADADAWMALLKSRTYGSDEISKLLQGEWNTSIDFMPVMLMKPEERPPDWEDLARAHAVLTQDSMQRARNGTLRDLYGFESLHVSSHFPNLSPQSIELAGYLSPGLDAWSRGYVRSAVVRSMNQAAMELVLLERSGEPLTAEAVSSVTRNPYDGTAFAFDPATRMLSVPHPAEGLDTDPVKLP